MGGGGGGGGHTPYEAPETGRSKQAVKIVEIISEGEIKGLINGVQSVFLDNTPIQNKDGTWNFSNIEAEGRIGIQDQDILEGFNTSEKEVSVGTQVRKNTPLTRTVSDTKVSRLRLTLGVQSLFQQNDQGDTHGASVTLNIFIGARVIPLTISGKYSSQYLRQIEIDNLPPTPFTVRVERIDEDSKSQRLQNNTIWASYTEIIETRLAYPNTALVGIKFDSDYFSSIPNRTYDVYGIIVQVPSNYNPETRAYNGTWDGTFKTAWSDNPAWVLYDLLKNKRYGFGRRLGDFAVDKWALYNVAQYCDQLVDDGFGGKEPRFTCNAWITEQRQAYDVINDICSIFRAMPVWNGREFTVIQDRPADPVWTYTNANVDKEGFTYSYSAMKARHNEIHVEYANAQNNYEKDVICVSDDDLIRRYGLNVKKVTAFGCTSRGQAYRTGRWILETEKLETRTVTFSVGAEGLMHVPGDIILVADNDYAGTQIGGRVLSVEQNTVTIDREAQFKVGDKFMFYNQAAEVVSVKVAEVLAGNKLRMEVPPAGLTEHGVWLRHGDKIQPQLYRALSIKEDHKGKYTITAIQHEPQKEAIVDNGAHFEPVSFSETPERYRIQNVDVAVTDGGVKLTFDYFAKNESTVKYQVKLYRTFDGKTSLYKVYDDLTTTSITFAGLPNGSYTAEIRAKNGVGQLSYPVTRTFEINLDIKRFVTKSLLFAIELDWDLPKTFTPGFSTEIWRSNTNDISTAVKVATLPYPQSNYVINGVPLSTGYYFYLRGVDKQGNKGEFTEAVFGEADHNPDNLLNALEGKITKSQLGQELINSLKSDIDTAVAGEAGLRQSAVANAVSQIMAESQARAKAIQDEAKARITALTSETDNRTKAIKAESEALTKKIQAEATARGTAVTQLQQTDAQQAQLISAVTAKVNNALSGVEAEKTARANADKAESQAREALMARVGTAESNIATIQRTVATNAQSISEVSQNLNSKIDNIKIGGRNLLRDSEFNLYDKWGNPKIDFAENVNRRTVKITSTGTSGSVGICPINHHSTSYFQQGKTYTLSCFARGNKALDYLYLMRKDGNNARLPVINITSETEFNYYKLTFTAPFTTHQGYFLIGFLQTGMDQFVEFHSVKLEQGNVATDWTPAPEDIDGAIGDISADLTSYKQTQATKEQAQASKIDGLVARVDGAESKITSVERSVSTLNSSTSTKFSQIEAGLNNAKSDLSSKIIAEQNARVNADKANADNIVAITSRIAGAESSISNIQSTKANKNEVASLAQSALRSVWQSDAQSAVDRLQVGGRNALIDSEYKNKSVFGNPASVNVVQSKFSNRTLTTIKFTAQVNGVIGLTQSTTSRKSRVVAGKTYTLSLNVQGTADIQATGLNYVFLMRDDGDNYRLSKLPVTASLLGRPTLTFTAPWTSNSAHLLIGVQGQFASGEWFAFHSVKLEQGNVATDWTPAPEDVEGLVNAVSADLTSYKQTQATKEQALGTRIDNLTASVNSAKSQISQVSNAVADVGGKLSATHTLKTQVISGGRTAIAGIALGATADNKTAESSVIVMADKFGVVADANDNNVRPMFSVTNGQVGIHGDLIANGSILGNKIRANTEIVSPLISGGQINIGGGVFTVNSNGHMVANSGVFKGRIEAVDGFFRGTVYADKIEGDIPRLLVVNPHNTGVIEPVNYDRIITLYELQNWIKSGGDNNDHKSYGSGKCTLVAKIWLNNDLIHDGTISTGDTLYGDEARQRKGWTFGNRDNPLRSYVRLLPKNTRAQIRYEFNILKEGVNTRGWIFGYSSAYINTQRAGTYITGSI